MEFLLSPWRHFHKPKYKKSVAFPGSADDAWLEKCEMCHNIPRKCSRVCDYTGRRKELNASKKKTTKLFIIMSRTEYVENIHETRLLCSQSMHDLPQSPEYCSPTKHARDAQPTHRDVVNVVLLFLHTVRTFPSY